MKRKMTKIVSLILLISLFLLQGCALTTPETSHLVKVGDDGRTLTAELKASTDDGYTWQYLFDNKIFAESSSNFTNNIFSNTYGSTYTYVANDVGTANFYLILVQNDDYQNAKVFNYVLNAGNDNKISIEKEGNFVLGSDVNLYNKVVGK
ncbi:MAG: protease inhibitor I42 family protein [Lachnospiraceae bacterium]|nr:protease inhibitor I42 family protein [Lachnospiraceae bacterium]